MLASVSSRQRPIERENLRKESLVEPDAQETILETLEFMMFDSFDNHAGGACQNGRFAVLDCDSGLMGRRKSIAGRGPTFSKVFRWQPSDQNVPMPATVELVGSFTNWQVEAMQRDAVTNTWQLTLHGIPGNRTHRYMLLVNGEPAQDKNCDGLAIAEGLEEQQYQLMTPRGPRVFLLFSQTK